jgi:serine/threonine protein kinase
LDHFAGTSRFDVRRRLGQGGMGIVYEAWDRERRQTVALKTLREIDATALCAGCSTPTSSRWASSSRTAGAGSTPWSSSTASTS